jgi:hypothetical protein
MIRQDARFPFPGLPDVDPGWLSQFTTRVGPMSMPELSAAGLEA